MAKSSHKKTPQTQTKNSKTPQRSPSHNSSQSRNHPTPGERRETRNQSSNKGKVLDARNRALNSVNGNRNSSKQKYQGKQGSQNKGISPKSKQIKKNPVIVVRNKPNNSRVKEIAKKQSERDSESSEEEIRSQRSSVQKGNSHNRGQQQSKSKEPESSRNGRRSQRNGVVKVEQNQQKKSSNQKDRMIEQQNSKQKQQNSQSNSIQQSSSLRSSSKNAGNQMARSRSMDRSIINSSSQLSNAKRSASVSKPLARSQSVASNREQRQQKRSGHVVVEDVTPIEGAEQRRHQVSKRELKQLFVEQSIDLPKELKQVSKEISNYKPQVKQPQNSKNLKVSQPNKSFKNNKSRSEKNSLKSSDLEDPESDLTLSKKKEVQKNNQNRTTHHRLREKGKIGTEKKNQNTLMTTRKQVKKSLYDSDLNDNNSEQEEEEEEHSQQEDPEQNSDDDHIEKESSKNSYQSKKYKKKQNQTKKKSEESSDIDVNDQSVTQSQKQVRFIVEEKEKKEPRKGILKNKKPTPYRSDSQKKEQIDEHGTKGSLLLRSRDDQGNPLLDTKSQPHQKTRDVKQTKNHEYNSELSSPISKKSSVPKTQQHNFDVTGGAKSHHTFNPHQEAMNQALYGHSKQGRIKERKASIPTKNITLNQLPRIQNPIINDDENEMDISSDSSINAQVNDVVSFLSADKRRNCEEVSDLEEVKNDQLPRPFITDMKRDKQENLPHGVRQMMEIFGIPPKQFQQMQLQQFHNQMMNFQNSKLLSHQTQSGMTKFQQQQTQFKQNSSLLMSANPIFAAPLPQAALPQQYRNGPQQMHQFEMPIAIPRQKSKRHPHRDFQNIRHISMSCDADNEETPARESMLQKRGRREITQFLQSSKKFEEDLKPQVLLSSKDQSQSIGGDIQPPQTPQEELTSHKEMNKFGFEKIQIGNELLAKDQKLKLEEQRSSSHAELNELLKNPTELSKQLTFGVQQDKVPVPPQQKLSQNSIQNPQFQQGFVKVLPSPAKLFIQQPPLPQNTHFNLYPPMHQHQYMNPQLIVPGFQAYPNVQQQQAFQQAAMLLNQQMHQKQRQQLANSSTHYPSMIQVPQMTLSQQFQGTPLSSQTTQNQVPFNSNIASNQTWVPSVQRINLPQSTGITPSEPVLATPVQTQQQIVKEENHIENDVEVKVKSTPQAKTPGQSVRKPNTRSQAKKDVFKLQRDSNTQTPNQMEQASPQKKKGNQSIKKAISSSSSEEDNINEQEKKQSNDEENQVNSDSLKQSSSSSEDAEFTQHLEEDVNMMQEQRSKTIQNHSHSESEILPMISDQEMPEQEENHNDIQEEAQSDDDQSLEGEIPSGELKVLDEEVNLSNCAWRLQKDYLNDEIINFMLNLAFNCADPQIKNYTVVLNTFIYSYLSDPNHSDERILKILKKKLRTDTLFLIIPINLTEQNHWSLAIIANVNLQLHPTHSFLQAFDKNKQPCPCFLYLDSLFKISLNTKTALNRACSLIMSLHHDNKYPKDAIYPYYSYRMNVPKQKNGIDCGMFLIEYVARFLKDPLSLIFNNSQQKEPIAFAFDHHLEDILSDFRMQPSDMDFALFIEAELRSKSEFQLPNINLDEEISKLFILRQIAEQTLNAQQEKLIWFDGAIVDQRRRHMRNLFKFLARAEDPNAVAKEAYMKYYPIKE